MGITPNFTQADVKAKLDRFMAVIEKRQIKRLQYLGEQCVLRARTNADFIDQTGNLRSSMGYVVFKNGVAIHESYDVVKSGSEGANIGKSVAQKAGSKYTSGICLVVTAGMNYALHVEARGRDVLTSTELFAKQEMPKLVAELKQNINKALG